MRPGVGLALVICVAGCGSDTAESPDVECATAEQVDGLRLNQLQVVGSHNSYRRRTYQPIYDFVQSLAAQLPEMLDPKGWDYDHLPLAQQLSDYGMRGLELDVYNDPVGGQFADRQGLRFVNQPVASGIAELNAPGLKVLHIPDVDYETHHHTFSAALQAIADWSAAHPTHLPIAIHIETKEATVADVLTTLMLTKAIPFDAAAAAAIDTEIRAVFATSRVISPDEVRGTHATLEEAVLAGGWPTVAASRGRVLFFLEGAAVDDYLAGAPNLEGRLVFPNAQPGQPNAAIVIANDAVGAKATITDLVSKGYIVRTMADGGTVESRTGDTTRSDSALSSGAHIVSTDYYRPDPRSKTTKSGWTNYKVKVPGGGPARTNPITGGGVSLRICE